MKQKRVNNKLQKKSSKNLLDEEISQLKQRYEELSNDKNTIKCFADFPISQKTQKGLAEAKYLQPTDIQRESIGPALQGKDVLGAAITGSGKTLAFLIPVLEHLFMNKWSRLDGVCAIIISPTRELAYQIFETLKKVGKYHDFSAGLIIGGKNLKFERHRMDQCNILICTPGRLLQHMDENPLFNANTMELLVLDEADRCLDMGFEQTLNAIIENFPPQRQTLLFSATQTRSVKDLARLNLQQPVYIGFESSVGSAKNEECEMKRKSSNSCVPVVPELLQQSYVVVKLEDKICVLWSFIKNHLKQKIIVFLSSCKQVKYVYEILCKLRPGTSILALYGTLHQDRRIAIYQEFIRKSNVVMLATDIASRGLDFPSVNWVVQLDCPEDVTQYIHRAGRSARNKTRGESLLVLMPSEEAAMVAELERKFIKIRKIAIDPKKLFSPLAKIESFLAQNNELKASAQRAFVSYIKSVFLMKNKHIFNVNALDLNAYARSLGLVVTPRVRFLERYRKKQNNANNENAKDTASESESVDKEHETKQTSFSLINNQSEDDSEDFLTVKRANHGINDKKESDEEDREDDDENLPLPVPRKKKTKLLTKAALAKRALKKKLNINEKRVFDDMGEEIKDQRKHLQSELAQDYEQNLLENDINGGINIDIAKQLIREEDKFDKERFRRLVKQRHKNLKEKIKRNNNDSEEEESIDDDCNDDDETSVDLSWLPDPSKVYKKTNSPEIMADNDSESVQRSCMSSKDDHDDDDDEDQPVCKKLKITSKLTLNDAETIASQLLANSL